MKKFLKILLILPLLFGCGEKSKIMNEKQFTQHYLKEIQKVFTEVDFKATSNLTITAKHSGLEYQHSLDNAYNQYRQNPESLDKVVSTYINAAVDIYMPAQEINIKKIVPVIKPRDYMENIKKLTQKKEDERKILFDKYDDDLVIMYGEDKDSSISYLNTDDISKLKIEKEKLLDLSLGNLKNIVTDIKRNGDDGVYMVTAGGDYEATLILWKELWKKETFPIKGEIVIAIPNRDLLLITGSEDKEGIEQIKKIANESYNAGNYEISPHLYKWNGEKFIKFVD